jgi:hypothetical protein
MNVDHPAMIIAARPQWSFSALLAQAYSVSDDLPPELEACANAIRGRPEPAEVRPGKERHGAR